MASVSRWEPILTGIHRTDKRRQCQHIGRAWKDVAGVEKRVHCEWTVGAGVDSVA